MTLEAVFDAVFLVYTGLCLLVGAWYVAGWVFAGVAEIVRAAKAAHAARRSRR